MLLTQNPLMAGRRNFLNKSVGMTAALGVYGGIWGITLG